MTRRSFIKLFAVAVVAGIMNDSSDSDDDGELLRPPLREAFSLDTQRF